MCGLALAAAALALGGLLMVCCYLDTRSPNRAEGAQATGAAGSCAPSAQMIAGRHGPRLAARPVGASTELQRAEPAEGCDPHHLDVAANAVVPDRGPSLNALGLASSLSADIAASAGPTSDAAIHDVPPSTPSPYQLCVMRT
ncbi:hypothetical protein GCM10010472_30680 [Pseudonocardia halophobica]|uniref:Uncharacterized protein n=1 Tax=Pseudonocardia halophobica TaxID=29401 RepID=A0A9W6NUH0_9PSEU|nr:hypothetical protein GCM10017577_04670 [Pseudonocardia halophobica]